MEAIRRLDEIGCGDALLIGDVVVVGAGVSGLAFAFRAAKAGRRVLVIEREPGRVGGCLHSHRLSDGFWFELGAHGAYATYGGFVEMAMATGALAGLLERGRARGRFGVGAAGAWRWSGPAGLVSRLRWLDEFACVVEARRTLPSPRLGHHEIVRDITAALDGQRLAITGNYFDGLAIEDCVQRSFGEWARVARDGVRA